MVLNVWLGLKVEPKKLGFKNKRRKREKQEKKRESKTNPGRYAKREMRPCVCEQTIWQCTGHGRQSWSRDCWKSSRMRWKRVKVRGIALDSNVHGITRTESDMGYDMRPPLKRMDASIERDIGREMPRRRKRRTGRLGNGRKTGLVYSSYGRPEQIRARVFPCRGRKKETEKCRETRKTAWIREK